MLEFTRIIREIDSELKAEWQPRAFAWGDQSMGGLHQRAVDRFERAIVACSERCDWVSLKSEAEIYKGTMLEILRAYKSSKGLDEQTSFLESLRGA